MYSRQTEPEQEWKTDWSDYDDTPNTEKEPDYKTPTNGKMHPTPEEATTIHRLMRYNIPATGYTTEPWFGNPQKEEKLLAKLREKTKPTKIQELTLDTRVLQYQC